MKNNRKKTKRFESEATLVSCLRCSAIGACACMVASTVLLLIFGAISLCFEDPLSSARLFAFLILYVSSFSCGCVSRALCRSYTLPCGLISGVLFAFAVFLTSFLYRGSESVFLSALYYLTLPVFSFLGALVASYKPSKRRRRKH